MEQIELGATVLPAFAPMELAIQVGRFQYVCPVGAFGEKQVRRFLQLYRAGCLKFGHPGDFEKMPAFLNTAGSQPNSRVTSGNHATQTKVGALLVDG